MSSLELLKKKGWTLQNVQKSKNQTAGELFFFFFFKSRLVHKNQPKSSVQSANYDSLLRFLVRHPPATVVIITGKGGSWGDWMG